LTITQKTQLTSVIITDDEYVWYFLVCLSFSCIFKCPRNTNAGREGEECLLTQNRDRWALLCAR